MYIDISLKKIKYILIITCVSLCSCLNKSSNNVNSNSKTISVSLSKTDKASEFFNSFELKKYISLESKYNSLIGNIESLMLSKDRIVISDDNCYLFIFTDEGKLIKTLKPGRGSGEFLDILDIQIDDVNEEIYVWSLSNKKMYIYDYNGKFRRTFNLDIPITKFLLLGNKNILCYTNYATSDLSKESNYTYNQVFLLHKNKDKWDVVFRDLSFHKKYAQQIVSAFGTTNLCKFKNNIYFMPPFETVAYSFNLSENKLEKHINFEFGKHSIPNNFIEKNGISNIFDDLRKNEYMIGWGNYYIDDDYFCFATMLNDTYKTVVCNITDNKVLVCNKFIDTSNELPVQLISNSNSNNYFVAISNPHELKENITVKGNSIGAKLSKSINEFDNPIILLYEKK